MKNLVGQIIDLQNAPVFLSDGTEANVSGRYMIEEYQGIEYDAGITSQYFTLFPVSIPEGVTEVEAEDLWVTVDPYVVWEIADPEGFQALLRQEREYY